jgi:hypothetical protein
MGDAKTAAIVNGETIHKDFGAGTEAAAGKRY